MAKNIVREIRKAPRRQFSAEEKMRTALEGLRGETLDGDKPGSAVCL